jgi:hypothetical protein
MGVLPVRFPGKKGKKTELARTGSVDGRLSLPLIERRADADVGNVPSAITVLIRRQI